MTRLWGGLLASRLWGGLLTATLVCWSGDQPTTGVQYFDGLVNN